MGISTSLNIPFRECEVQQNTTLSLKLKLLFDTGLNGLFPGAPQMIFFFLARAQYLVLGRFTGVRDEK